ncbi:MAG: HAD family hydrolase [Anaerolineae bacterium]|jgi:phosphoglycolate phosphatase
MSGLERITLGPAAIGAVLFDLDGTLMDTDDQVVENLTLRLRRLRGARLQGSVRWMVMAAETPANFLMTALDALGLDGPLLGLRNWLQDLRGGTRQPEYRLMEGAKAVLRDLQERYVLAIVTTRGRRDADAFLDQHGLRDMFDVVVTRESTWRLKPHPAPIRQAAELLGVPVERCAMVGDATVDVRGARRAGAKAVAVTCGFGQRRELERAGADVILEGVWLLSSVL